MTKDRRYLVLETQAQAFKEWTPFPGQLRLQAWSHVASGAGLIGYWHWHSLHNSYETYWKGILSHDLQPNPVYQEVCQTGAELRDFAPQVLAYSRKSRIALVVSNECLTAIDWHPWRGHQFSRDAQHQYNDIFRLYYDTLYRMNIEVDILAVDDPRIFQYEMLIFPLLYTVSDEKLRQINDYISQGGHAIFSFKSAFADENMQVRTCAQPGIISSAVGARYQLFVEPQRTGLTSNHLSLSGLDTRVHDWIELLEPEPGATVLARYDHPYWHKYAAVSFNRFEQGSATYIGCHLSAEVLAEIFRHALAETALAGIADEHITFPVIMRQGFAENNQQLIYYFNYSAEPQRVKFSPPAGRNLFSGENIHAGDEIHLGDWDVQIILLENQP